MEADAAPAQWHEAVTDASQRVEERVAAEEAAAARQRPRSQVPRLAAATLVLASVVAWDVRLLVAPPPALPASEEVENLVWHLHDAIELVEDFHAERGRLPTSEEAGDIVGGEVAYRVEDAVYVLGLPAPATELEYRSDTPVAEWLAVHTSRAAPSS